MDAHIVKKSIRVESAAVSTHTPNPGPLPSPIRRRVVASALLAALAGLDALAGRKPATAAGPAPDAVLGGAAEYARERRIAIERGQALVLFFSLAGCVFCEALRADQLRHVHRERERLGIRLVELRMDDDRPIPGIEPPRSPRQIASAFGVRVSPTVLFVDGEREVAERLVGYSSPDFYGAYLDARIALSHDSAGGQRPPAR